MTTNQTIDGVPREPKWSEALLKLEVVREALTSRDSAERLKNMDAGKVLREGISILKELRALLGAPATEERGSSHGFEQSPNTCRHDERSGVWWREGSITRTGRECCACGSVEEDPVEPAAQPQGEPVAWMSRSLATGQCEQVSGPEEVNNLEYWSPAFPVYAEQPAPVAVVRMCDCNQGRLPCNGKCKP